MKPGQVRCASSAKRPGVRSTRSPDGSAHSCSATGSPRRSSSSMSWRRTSSGTRSRPEPQGRGPHQVGRRHQQRAMKEETRRKLTAKLPKGMRVGFKLFFEEDGEFGPLMTPAGCSHSSRPSTTSSSSRHVELRGRWRRARRATSRPRRPMACASHPGESEPPAATLGPLGRADRLNWLAKKRRRNTSNQCRIVTRS